MCAVAERKETVDYELKVSLLEIYNETIQDLLGHSKITTTQCYCRVSNLKVQRDYYKAIQKVLERTLPAA